MPGHLHNFFLLQELTILIQTNEDDIEEKVTSITANLEVRKVQNQLSYVVNHMIFFCHSRPFIQR